VYWLCVTLRYNNDMLMILFLHSATEVPLAKHLYQVLERPIELNEGEETGDFCMCCMCCFYIRNGCICPSPMRII